MQALPVIFLAFANDKQTADGYLRNLTLERNSIRNALKKASSGVNHVCEIIVEPDATIDTIFDTFQDEAYRGRIAIFHYGGHADDYKLLLENAKGKKSAANADGLVPFLAHQQGIQLVFLNGCSTQSQADALVDAGIPAVIGTTCNIQDQIAQIIAARFYQGLGEGISLRNAWDETMHYIKSNGDLNVTDILAAHEDEHYGFPWYIRYTTSSRRIQEWNLPDAAENPIFGLPEIDSKYYLNLPPSPYLGLRRFEQQHAAIFFGRNSDTRKLIDKIHGIHPVILYYGQSGAGKSSLLEAGVIPRLENSHTVMLVRRNKELGLTGSFQAGLQQIISPDHPMTTSDLPSASLLEKWKWVEKTMNKPLIFILDQVEETFTKPLAGEEDEWLNFCSSIHPVTEYLGQTGVGTLVLSFRSEYLPQIQNILSDASIPKTDLLLLPINKSGIREAISGVTKNEITADHYRFYPNSIEEELMDEIVHDLLEDKHSPVAPMLQILLTKLWERAEILPDGRRRITRLPYLALRKDGIALSDFVDEQFEIVKKLNKDKNSTFYNSRIEESGLLLDLLMQFVTSKNTTDALSIEELKKLYPHRKEILDALIEHLIDVHLLSDFVEEGKQKVSLAHDTLAPIIREMYHISARPGQSAHRILESDRKISEIDLVQIEEGASGMRAWTPTEVQVIQESRVQREILKKQRQRRMILFWCGIVTILIFAITATFLGLIARRNAIIAKTHALATQAQLDFNDDPTLALNLALTAYTRVEDNLTGISLSKITAQHSAIYNTTFTHPDQVNAVAISHDEKYVVTGSADSTARLWNLDGTLLQEFKGHTGPVLSVAISPDAHYVLTGSADHTARLWSLNGSPITYYKGHHQEITSVAFSPDGKFVLTGSQDSTARIWTLDGEAVQTFSGHQHEVTAAVYAPDGKSILTGSEDRTAKLWSLNGTELQTFIGHEQAVLAVAFSPDGKSILTGSEDSTARCWVVDGTLLHIYKGHTDEVSSVVFSPDGNSILTGSWDNTTKLWSLNGDEMQSFKGHTSFVAGVAFSSDGKKVLTGSRDHTAKLWALNAMEVQTINEQKDILSAAFSPDGKYIITGSINNLAKLWSLDGKEIQEFKGHNGPIYSVVFSHDGNQVLTGSGDGTAILWNLDGTALQTYAGHEDPLLSVAFSPDGKYVLTGSWDHTAKLWSLDGKELQSFIGHSHIINAVSFSPDGKNVLTGSWDHTAKLWSLDGKEIHTYAGHTGYIWSVAFSPNGKYILTGSSDKTAKLWSLDGKVIQTFEGHEDVVRMVAFSPDGKYILTGSVDHTAKLWTDDGIEVQTFAGHREPITSVAFSPDGQYILTGSLDKTAKLWYRWDYLRKNEILAPLTKTQKIKYGVK